MKIVEIVFTDSIKKQIQSEFHNEIVNQNYKKVLKIILELYHHAYNNVPENKRISYGSYYIVKILGEYLFKHLTENNIPVFDIVSKLYDFANERKIKGIILNILSYQGLYEYKKVLPYIKLAAEDNDWEVREFAAGFINKITKKYPTEVKEFYLSLVNSKDENIRRFVSESLRPVSENSWFIKNPEYPLSILKHLYKEPKNYPRTSVGNNLSDWSKRKPEMVYGIVKELADSGDKNSYWIAYRACRNLVKKEPIRVMDILQVDEYKYKDKIYYRNNYTKLFQNNPD